MFESRWSVPMDFQRFIPAFLLHHVAVYIPVGPTFDILFGVINHKPYPLWLTIYAQYPPCYFLPRPL